MSEPGRRRGACCGTSFAVIAIGAWLAAACGGAGDAAPREAGVPASGSVGWPVYAADAAATHYSPLAGINRDSIGQVEVAWEWATGDRPLEEFGTRPGQFQNTPLMIDGVLYLSTPYNRVVALDAETGAEIWAYDPRAYEDGQPFNGTGFVHRGVAAWRGGEALRIFINSRYRLICLDAATGLPVPTFGEDGIVDLSEGLIWEIERKHYSNTSPPLVYRDLVIVGNGVGDRLMYRRDPPGDVRAFDARTGEMVWTFHPIPQPGEFGHETWGDDSWQFTGHTNVWAPTSLDEERGLLYLPLSTPSNDFYGGRRPGANLFAESLVCLDALTGERKWHFQIVHHGLWDYDLPAAPILTTLTVEGRRIDAVVQLTKQGFAFVFDRVTGEPVWPIEERPVGASDVPGEEAWPTQPFPTKPPPFADQGVTLDDAFDLTPELHEQAVAGIQRYRLGPLYTPPSFDGTLMRPGIMGGANWGGGAVDPGGVLYVKSSGLAHVARLRPFDAAEGGPRAGEVDADYIPGGGGPRPAGRRSSGEGGSNADFMDGLPLVKPPWAFVTAIDLNRSEVLWRVPFGDTTWLREHPALEGVELPRRIGALGPAGTIATAGGLVIGGGGAHALYALDAATGEEVWQHPLSRVVTGTPMTYLTASGRQFIVVATTGEDETALVAFATPRAGEGATP